MRARPAPCFLPSAGAPGRLVAPVRLMSRRGALRSRRASRKEPAAADGRLRTRRAPSGVRLGVVLTVLFALAAAAAVAAVVSLRARNAARAKRAIGTWAPVHGVRVVRTLTHSEDAFTQGLVWMRGSLWESTGLVGHSRVRRLCARTGETLAEVSNSRGEFGEGLARGNAAGDELVQLTWRDGVGHVWSARGDALRRRATFELAGEMWGLAAVDGLARLYFATDGTATVRVLRREGDALVRDAERDFVVRDGGRPVALLNEVEVVGSELWANIWMSDLIARIDPVSGVVRSWIDCASLRAQRFASPGHVVDVLNGIAYDAESRSVYVTGKLWPRIFQIEVEDEVSATSVQKLNPFFMDDIQVSRIFRSTGRAV